MPRIRSIKPEFCSSDQVLSLSLQARLLFICMWCWCDDAGRHPAKLRQLRAEVFPGDDAVELQDVQRWMEELKEGQLVLEYEVEGARYWAVTGWHHQRIDKPQPARYPGPQEDDESIPRWFRERSLSLQNQQVTGESGNGQGDVQDHSRNVPAGQGNQRVTRTPGKGRERSKNIPSGKDRKDRKDRKEGRGSGRGEETAGDAPRGDSASAGRAASPTARDGGGGNGPQHVSATMDQAVDPLLAALRAEVTSLGGTWTVNDTFADLRDRIVDLRRRP